MEKVVYRAVIDFFIKQGKTPQTSLKLRQLFTGTPLLGKPRFVNSTPFSNRRGTSLKKTSDFYSRLKLHARNNEKSSKTCIGRYPAKNVSEPKVVASLRIYEYTLWRVKIESYDPNCDWRYEIWVHSWGSSL